MKFAVLGFGGRGIIYTHLFNYCGSELTAVCEPNTEKKAIAARYGLSEENFYTDENAFFKAGKLADALVISTMDDMHYRQTMKALDLGYDILLEKPIAMTLRECEKIRDKANSLGRKVVVCHVLRYTPFFDKVKSILESGEIGEVVCMEMVENVGYFHYAHSFCRGNWRNTDISTPLIVAKNCHDTDMISWLIGKKCLAVSSFGSLKYFKEENAPEGSASHCYLCKYKDSCKYSGFYIYNNEEYEKAAGLAKHARLGMSKEEIDRSLSNPDNLYARCVFRCDNNVVDNQIVNMLFEDNVVAQLKTIAFTNSLEREFVIHGTEGIIYNSDDGNIIVEKINGAKEKRAVEAAEGGFTHHMGGDIGIARQFIDYMENGVKTRNITDIDDSVMSHKMAFLAEESRLNGGKTYYLD